MGLASAALWLGFLVLPSCCLPPALSTLMTQPKEFPINLRLDSRFSPVAFWTFTWCFPS